MVSINANWTLSVILWLQACVFSELNFTVNVRPKLCTENKLYVQMTTEWCCDDVRLSETDVLILKLPPQIADVEWLQQAQCVLRWFNGKRSLAHTSLGKTKVNTSFLLSCECTTPAERFIIHQLETAQCWFHHGGIQPKKKQRKLSQPHKISEIKEAILQSCNENQKDDFFFFLNWCTFNNSGTPSQHGSKALADTVSNCCLETNKNNVCHV